MAVHLVLLGAGIVLLIGQAVSHAHSFYTTITRETIAKAMATAINKFEGYTTTYTDGDTFFIINADEAVEGETLAVKMVENKSQIHYAHIPAETVVENNIEPTETTDGSYENVIYCSFCGEELSREKIVVPATGEKNPGETDPGKTEPGKTDPGETGTPDGDTNNGTDGTSVSTGDTGNAALWFLLFVMAGACLGAVICIENRKRNHL